MFFFNIHFTPGSRFTLTHLTMKFFLFIVSCISAGFITAQPAASIKDGSVYYETPLAYEAMHVALALTDTNVYSGSINVHAEVLDTSSAYYKEVQQQFQPFRNHPLVVALNEALRKDLLRYAQNIKLAYNSSWQNGELKENNVYPLPMKMLYQSQSVSRKLLEDFMQATRFETFYAAHVGLYTAALQKVKTMADVHKQQQWLEQQFDARYQQYFIVVSPLMGSTNFTNRMRINKQESCIMYVADAKKYADSNNAINNALYTGIVMTEIDHNYVNPVSDGVEKQLDKLMGDDNRKNWMKPNAVGQFYGSGYKIFNEYMTHAVYLLYTATLLDAASQQVVEANRINIMKEGRGFHRFDAFYAMLKQLNASKQVPVQALYKEVMDWCQQQQGVL